MYYANNNVLMNRKEAVSLLQFIIAALDFATYGSIVKTLTLTLYHMICKSPRSCMTRDRLSWLSDSALKLGMKFPPMKIASGNYCRNLFDARSGNAKQLEACRSWQKSIDDCLDHSVDLWWAPRVMNILAKMERSDVDPIIIDEILEKIIAVNPRLVPITVRQERAARASMVADAAPIPGTAVQREHLLVISGGKNIPS